MLFLLCLFFGLFCLCLFLGLFMFVSFFSYENICFPCNSNVGGVNVGSIIFVSHFCVWFLLFVFVLFVICLKMFVCFCLACCLVCLASQD